MTRETCPKCQSALDAGFRFCDQCGVELKECPACKRVGHKPRCQDDGEVLVPRSKVTGPAPTAAGPAAVPAPGPSKIALRQVNGSLRLFVDSPKTIGRREGEFKAALGGYSQISRAHAKIFRSREGNWLVEDLGSSNKTYVNDVEASVGHPLELSAAGIVRFADVAFVVEPE